MSMSTYVYGLREADDRHRKLLAIKRACEDAGIEYPPEVARYFVNGKHDTTGDYALAVEVPVEEINDDTRTHYIVDLQQLPPGIRRLRFTNSW